MIIGNTQKQIREARAEAGLSAREAAELVGVSMMTWQRWEGQTSRPTSIPKACWELFLLKVGQHPTHILKER